MRKKHTIKEPIATAAIHLQSGDVVAPCYTHHAGDLAIFPAKPDIYTVKRGRHKKAYLMLYAGFDIETTNVITEEYKRAFMYIWQFAICDKNEGFVYLGRTWEDFEDLIKRLQDFYKLNEALRFIIWDANFGFEFQFIRKHFEWSEGEFDFFAKEERKPLLATTGNIEFREALSISGGSLAQLAKDYTVTQKLKGDLDYKIPRNSKTPLSPKELQYCINDVVILVEFSEFIFFKYIIPNKKCPLTKTGLLRQEVKDELVNTAPSLDAYMGMIQSAYPDEMTYKVWFRYLFRGGFVHSNFSLTNKILTNCRAFDITSSYPARMFLSYFPVTPFKKVKFQPEYLKKYCCFMVVKFYNIRTTTYHSIESLHKVIEGDEIKTDNGRVYKAKYMKVMLTELDFDTYRKYYKWDKCVISQCHIAKRGRLPKFIRGVLARHYIKKAQLKAQGLNDTPEYAIVKSGVNAAFGLTVTRLSLDKVAYTSEGWATQEVALDFTHEKEKQFLLPQWGIYVAAAGRHELLSMVYEITQKCGNVVAYCDTDSIKCLPHPELDGIISTYNERIASELKAAGLTQKEFADLGFFDDEAKGHTITRFKTLGAKRYLTEIDGSKIKATIAGLPKATILHQKDKDGNLIDAFTLFDVEGMEILAENSDKITTFYNDEYTACYVDGELMEEESSVALYDIPFSMHTERDYYNMLFDESLLRRKL